MSHIQTLKNRKLQIIKGVHTIIWFFFVAVIFYVVYSGLVDKVNIITWICIAAVLAEGLVLLLFKMFCPLTVLARKYSSSEKANFDIYLPLWLARHNKLIFTAIFMIGLLLVLWRVALSG
ncbi:hypothetical protein [Reichenbachiella sp. MALMAid0571]|uniref:hypothetical protein n=1 Tax=Reichenbachiella sp. MALMAid0571 TaxID=3143939 RepID=UPI0032DE5BC7